MLKKFFFVLFENYRRKVKLYSKRLCSNCRTLRLTCREDLKNVTFCAFSSFVCVFSLIFQSGESESTARHASFNKGTQVDGNAKIGVGRIVEGEAREKEKQKKMY